MTKIKTIAVTILVAMTMSVSSAMAVPLPGVNIVTVPANSDAYVSIAFTPTAAATFAVNTVTGSGVTVSGTPLKAGAYNNIYYVRLTSGSGKGLWSTITSNTTNTLVFADTSFLGSISPGDTFNIYPHATLGNTFKDGLEGTLFKKSASSAIRSTEILFPDTTSAGINKAPTEKYYYFKLEWRKVGALASDNYNDKVIPPQQYFIIRNNNNANPLKFITHGIDMPITLAALVPTGSVKNDMASASGSPKILRLKDLNLGGTPAFKTSTSTAIRQDELKVFTNGPSGINRAPDVTYYYYNNAWRKVGALATDGFDGAILPPGAAMIIRKASGTPATNQWTEPLL